MKVLAVLALGLTLGAAAAPRQTSAADRTVHDLVLKNGTVHDGSGPPAYTGDIAIDGDLIAYVGPARDLAARTTIDVSAPTVRTLVLGEDDVQPSPAQLDQMRALVDQAMEEGALGLTTALIYAPAT
jgi:N-acyl-D-aspartate/D-glutamate deacylase